MVTHEQVLDALREVIDPELGINVVDLGLVYTVDLTDGRIRVAMTVTTRACPLHAYLTENAEAAIREIAPDAAAVKIEMVWDPPWVPAMMSDGRVGQWRGPGFE